VAAQILCYDFTRGFDIATIMGWLGLAHIASGTLYIELYRVQHRPASELVAVAQAALGDRRTAHRRA